jgi:hypothetical protein
MPVDRSELLAQLHELARLELDLVVRDLDVEAALQALIALREELAVIGAKATTLRAASRERIAGLEEQLETAWGGQAAVEILMALAESRRDLAELDGILGPSQVLTEELVRRTARSKPAE